MFDLSTVWLKTNYFFLSNKQYFRKWWMIALIAVAVFIVIFAFTNVILYLFSIPKQNQLMAHITSQPVDYAAIRQAENPLGLQITSSQALPSGNGVYDLVTQVNNNNEDWAATTISYSYTIGNYETDVLTDFILPASQKYLMAASVPLTPEQIEAGMTLTIHDVDWERIVDKTHLELADFQITNVNFNATSDQSTTAFWVTADIDNQSLVGFWQARFAVALYSFDKLVGFDYVYFDSFRTNEQRSLYTQWQIVAGTVNKVEITPDVDLLDRENVMR